MKSLSYLFIIIVLFSFGSCKKGEKHPPLPNVSIVDISQESGWDYWVVGKHDYYYVKTNNSIPREVLFHSSEANKDYSIFISENGQLDKVVFDDYIVVFRNFIGSKVDMAIIYPDGNIQVLRQVETGYDWGQIDLKDISATQAWSDVIRGAARVAAGVPCALSVAASIGSGGAAIPLAAWTCGNFLLGLTADVMENDFEVHNGFTDFVNTYSEVSTVISCNQGNALECATGTASKALNEWANSVEIVENNRNKVNVATSALKYGYGDIQITLTWDNTADIDLHVIDPMGEEIYWNHKQSASGGILDVDDIDGYGPENIYWPLGKAPNGTYQVYVHQYPWDNKPSSSNYTVLVYAFGKSKTFSGHITKDQVIHLTDFNENGFINNNTKRNITVNKNKK